MVFGALVEGGTDHIGIDAALHIGHFLRPLVYQEDDQLHLGVVGGDAVGDLLQQDRLAGLGRRDDHAALAFSDRYQEINNARGKNFGAGFHTQLLVRVHRDQ